MKRISRITSTASGGEHVAQAPRKRAAHLTRCILLCVGIGVMLTGVRLALACATPMAPCMIEASDDLLLVQYAHSLSSGNWLGAYGKMTLAKNPGYSFVLILPGMLGISYQALFVILQALSALCFALVAYDVLGGAPGALAAYLLLLFMPELFTFELFQRVYRMGIVIPFTISLFTAYIALYLRRDRPARSMFPWAVIAGCSLFALFILKEDGTWVLPYVGVVSAILLIHWLRGRRAAVITTPGLVARLAVLVIPVALLLAGTGAIRAQNARAYGVATTCERSDTGFARFASQLLLIEGGNDNPKAWVQTDALEQAIEASPTLASIAPEIRLSFDEWPGGEKGDLIFWLLRNAYEHAGGFTDGASTNAFWSAAAQELEQALDSGALTRKSGVQLASLLPPLTASDVPPLARLCAHNLRVVMFHQQGGVAHGPGNGELSDQRIAAQLLRGPTAIDDGSEPSPLQNKVLDLNEKVLSATRSSDGVLCGIRMLSVFVLLYLGFAKRYRPAQDACLFCLGLVLSMAVLLIGVSIQTSYLTDNADWAAFMYCAGLYPLMWMTTALSVGVCIRYAVDRAQGHATRKDDPRPAS